MAKLTYKLTEPVTLGSDKPVEVLEMSLKGKHLRGHKQSEQADFHALAIIGVKATEHLLPEKFVDEMSANDVVGLGTLVLGFLMRSPPAGSTPSAP